MMAAAKRIRDVLEARGLPYVPAIDDTTPPAIAARAVALDGTPFRHQGRQPGIGLDCAGVVVCAIGPRAAAIDRRDYPADPPAETLLSILNCGRFERLDIACIDAVPPGMVVAFRERGPNPDLVHHVGVRTEGGLVHARRHRPTREVSISHYWRSMFWGAYRWRSESF